jgi:cysteinyl-tRNA synthetase
MGKSLGNGILLDQLFSGNHPLLEKAYDPMTIRFFILQAHYRSTLDFSNEALQASEKGLARLMKSLAMLPGLPVSDETTINLEKWKENCYNALNDDLNTPILIAHLFDMVRLINLLSEGREKMLPKVMEMILSLRQEAKKNKDFALSDRIRDELGKLGIVVKDKKDGADWETIRL